MAVSAADRRRKLRLVTDYLCFFQPADLLFHYRDQAVVPGICTEHFCDCIITIGCDEAAGWCPQCDRDTLQSILIFAGTH